MQPPTIKYDWISDDGNRVTIRPIRPEDREIEQAFVRGLSSDSKYLRFFSGIVDLSPRMLDRFTQVDFPREMAFIATVKAETRELEIGVARYAPGELDNSVEFAVVVADEWQGRGIGRELLRRLFDVAEESGFSRIEGTILRANKNMLALCRQLGFTVSQCQGDAGLISVAKELGVN